MKIKDIMSQNVISVKQNTTMYELLELFKDFHNFPTVPVVDENRKLIGIISLKNIIEIFEPTKSSLIKSISFIDQEEVDLFELNITDEMKHLYVADDLMERKILALNEEMILKDAYNFMKLHNLDEILVVNNENILVGIVGTFDIVQTVLTAENNK